LLLIAALASVFVGLDCWLTYSRMRLLGPLAELNPIVSKIARNLSIRQAALFLGFMNALIIAGLVYLDADKTLCFFAGLKVALFVLQLKGYIVLKQHPRIREELTNSR